MRKLKNTLFLFLMVICGFSFVSCELETKHFIHKWIKEPSIKYLKSAPTATSKGVYYKICSKCGAVSTTETFEYGEYCKSLKGEFSVSKTKKIQFSSGNLQAVYNGTSYDWMFAPVQSDYIGESSGNTTIDNQTKGFVVNLFGWSTDSTNYGINTSTDGVDYSGVFKDWGTVLGSNSKWRTLSNDEWKYLIYVRPDAAKKVGYATVNGVFGIILLPDTFTDPMTNNGRRAFVPKETTGWNVNKYSKRNWAPMEASGAVFLPAGGRRFGSGVYSAGSYGYYWTSTIDVDYYACDGRFNSNKVYVSSDGKRSGGRAVRLVQDCD